MNSSRTLGGHRDSVFDVCWSPLGDRLVSGGRDGLVLVWSADGTLERSYELPGLVGSVGMSPDGAALVAGTLGGDIRAWDAAGGERLWAESLPSAETLACSPDGAHVLVGGEKGALWILDRESGRPVRSLDLDTERILSLAFSPGSDVLAVATWDSGVWFLDTAAWDELCHEPFGPGAVVVYRCAFAPDGETAAAALHFPRGGAIGTTDDPDLYEIALWRPFAEDPDLSHTLLGHVSWMRGLAFAPSGDLLVSGGFDESVRLWDPAFHSALGESREHQGAVYGIAFAPHGDAFASCSADRTVKVWEVGRALEPGPRPAAAADIGSWEQLLLGLLEGAGQVGRSPLLFTAQRLADDLLAIESAKRMDEAVARLVDAAFSLALYDLGRAVTQTLTVRGEHARRTNDEVTAFRCARLNALFAQHIRSHTTGRLAGLGEDGEPDVDRAAPVLSPAFDRLVQQLDGVVEGTVDAEEAGRTARDLAPTADDLRLLAGRLQGHWPEILRGERPGDRVRDAATIVTDLAAGAGDDLLLAMANDLLGRLLSLAGDHEAGVGRLEVAMEAARRVGDHEVLQALGGNLANAYRNVGRLRDARLAYDEALALAREHDHHEGRVNHLANLAIVESDLGNREAEHELLREAWAVAQARGLDEQAARVANNLGTFYYDVGDHDGAAHMYAEALAAAERLGDARLRASALGNLAQALAASGQRERAGDLYAQALAEARRLDDASGETHALHGLSRLAREAGDAARALELAEVAVRAARRAHLPDRLMLGLADLAELRADANRRDEAVALLQRAAAVGEGLRAQIERPSEGRRVQSRLAGIYDHLVQLLADAGRPQAAFEASERGRAALLLRRLQRDTAAYRPRGAADVLAALEQVGPGALLVSYHLAGDELLAFVLRAGEPVAVERRPVPPGFLDAVRDDFEREVRTGGHHPIGETWLRLGALVLEPVVPHLRDDDLVLIAPHRELHNLALHALRVDGQRLLERWPVAYLPSASALPHLLAEPGGRPAAPVVIGAHFVDEALAVAAALEAGQDLIGTDVAVDDALRALAAADLLHISAHGFFSAREPGFSGWVLRPSPELWEYLDLRGRRFWERTVGQTQWIAQRAEWAEASILNASDLEASRLDAPLVVASACESGVIATDAADDPTGLVPALIEAGARGVVATLWLVDADTTAAAMTRFYGALAGEPHGWARCARALQAAALEAKRERDHPYFWAPYVLIGGLSTGEAA